MLTGYLRQRRRTLLAFFLFGGIFAAAFALYQLPLRAVAYPFVLCAAAGAVLLALDYRRVLRQHRRLERCGSCRRSWPTPCPRRTR